MTEKRIRVKSHLRSVPGRKRKVRVQGYTKTVTIPKPKRKKGKK
jgi:hypothetical protein